MTTMNFRVEDSLKNDFMKLVEAQGITATEVVMKLIKEYISDKVEENGLYSLLLSQDYVPAKEEEEDLKELKALSKEELAIADTEIIKL